MLAIVLCVCVLAGKPGVCLLLAIVGMMAIHEYSALLGVREEELPALIAIFVITAIQYLFIFFGNEAAFRVFVPLAGLAILALVQLIRGRAQGYAA